MSLATSVSGINAAAGKLDVIGANVANSQTVGFKESKSLFSDIFVNKTAAGQMGSGAMNEALVQQFGQGNLQTSSNPLDVAINGNGFFQVMSPDGSLTYARNGQFHVDKDQYLVTADGNKVMGANGPIQIDMAKYGGTLQIGPDGTIQGSDGVTKDASGNLASQNIATLQLHSFRNINGLENLGDNQWGVTAAAGAEVSGAPGSGIFGVLQGGAVEASNADLNNNLVEMIMAQREYQGNSQVFQTQSDMEKSLINL
jgi:flagellar basal-body rod protein FlgG